MSVRVARLVAAAAVAGSVLLSGVGVAHAENDPGNGGRSSAHADIEAKYKQNKGTLGKPKEETKCGLINGGCRRIFEHGTIYWTHQTKAHILLGAVRARWNSSGGAKRFGYPKSDEIPLGHRTGVWQDFQNVRIHWSPNTGAHATFGAIGGKWDSMRRERSALGLPTSEEIQGMRDNGARQHFEHGVVLWSPRTGAHPVLNGPIMDSWAAGHHEHKWTGKYNDRKRNVFGYGYPVGDPSGDRQAFEFGTIYNNANQKAVDWAFRSARGEKFAGRGGAKGWRGGKIVYGLGEGHGSVAGPTNGRIDCSGYVRWLYNLGYDRDVLGRTYTKPMYFDKKKYRDVTRSQARPGDFFVWSNGKSGKNHSGHVIMVVRKGSNGRFVVAEATSGSYKKVVMRETAIAGKYKLRRLR